MADSDEDLYSPETTDDMEVLAFNVARLRKRLGMSQTALAQAMQEQGLSHWRQNTVSRVETGKQELSVRELRALGEILGPVLGGTDFAGTLAQAARGTLNAMLVLHLRRLHLALDKSMTELAQADAEIRWLRTAFDDDYEPTEQELEGRGEGLGEHHEEA